VFSSKPTHRHSGCVGPGRLDQGRNRGLGGHRQHHLHAVARLAHLVGPSMRSMVGATTIAARQGIVPSLRVWRWLGDRIERECAGGNSKRLRRTDNVADWTHRDPSVSPSAKGDRRSTGRGLPATNNIIPSLSKRCRVDGARPSAAAAQ